MRREECVIGGKEVVICHGNVDKISGEPRYMLIQPVDQHDLDVLDSEVRKMEEMTEAAFVLAAFRIHDWNTELTPWNAPPVWGEQGFGDGAKLTLNYVVEELVPELEREYGSTQRIIGGYSLAGLFALWCGYQTGLFSGIAAGSPSVWYPGWMDFIRKEKLQVESVYLSLGDREERTRNQLMKTIGDNMRAYAEQLAEEESVEASVLEWNQGNHFREPDLRMAKAFTWVMNRQKEDQS